MSEAKGREWLFHGPCGTTNKEIIRWWESRRLDFNLYVGITGIITWLLVLIAGGASVKPGVDFEEPFGMIAGPIVYAVLANMAYTLGWILDVATYHDGPRRAFFKAGFICSIVLTALPGLWAVAAYLFTLYTGKKLD